MAVTKILARNKRLDVAIAYVLNGDKTDGQILTAYQHCTPLNPYAVMMRTKERYDKTDGVQGFHVIQSFAPGEIEPFQALEIARRFVSESLVDFEAVIGVHQDKEHIHAHIIFNSVSRKDGHKYRSTTKSYLEQIRGVSDRLCKEYGLSVIMREESGRAMSYSEWRQQRKGTATLKDTLCLDIQDAIERAGDYGNFLMLMEHMGYEIKHGQHLAFRLRGTENFIRPGRHDARFTEYGIRAAILGSLEAEALGLSPTHTIRRPFSPFRQKTKLKGFMALYVHYLHLLGKIKKRVYPLRMTPHLRQAIMKFKTAQGSR